MKELPAIYQDGERTYYADTCEPLKAAAVKGDVQMQAWGHAPYPGTLLPGDFLPVVRSIGVWDAPNNQSWGLDLHCNEGIEFTYLKRGQIAFEVDGKQWLLRKGVLTITRPWQFHRVGAPHIASSQLIWLIFDVAVRRPNQTWRWPEWLLCSRAELQRLTKLLSHNEQPVWQATTEIEIWFDRLAELMRTYTDPVKAESRLKLAINGLLLAVMEMLEGEHIALDEYLSTTERAVQMFLNSLSQHAAADWDLESMARQCGLSRTQFSKYCRRLTGMTPIQYLMQCRVEMAERMLVECTDVSVTEVAYACGFSSSQYFATVFRNIKGYSPSSFKREGYNIIRRNKAARIPKGPQPADLTRKRVREGTAPGRQRTSTG
jgi:AraC family L-rhamnose operon regulatory protein RhaS